MANLCLAVGVPDIGAVGSITIVTTQGEINVSIIPIAGGPSGGAQDVLVFANNAAMAAFDVSVAPNTPGQLAIVETTGALWCLQPSAEGSNNKTIVTANGAPTLRWLRTNTSTKLVTYLTQTTWVVDPVGGNDEALGITALTALQTHAEIYRRWGYTWSPNLIGVSNFSVETLATQTDANDPTLFAPNLVAGATFKQFAPRAAPSFTGTLLAVTPKNRPANTALHSTFTTTTGAITSSLVLVNTTRGNSRAMAVTDTGGGNWLLTQPLTPYAGGFPSSTLVDTWANGDAIQGFTMVQVDVATVGAQATTFDGSIDPAHLVQDIAIIDSNGNFGSLMIDSSFAAFEDCPIGRAGNILEPICISENCSFPASVQGDGRGSLTFTGCFIGSGGNQSNLVSHPGGASLFLDTILVGGSALGVLNANIQSLFLGTDAGVQFSGDCRLFGTNSVYGQGLMNVPEGCFNVEANTGTNGLPITSLQLNGQATAYSFAGAISTVHRGVGLSGANLDAASGAAGFGGFAFAPGAAISLAGAQP